MPSRRRLQRRGRRPSPSSNERRLGDPLDGRGQPARARRAAESDRAAVIAVASRDPARAEAYAREHSLKRAYGSYDIIAKQRGDVNFVQQSMYYPMTDALTNEDSESYRLFKDGPYGTAETMEWFWNTYLPEQDLRVESTVSPLRATLDELKGLPPALVIVDENDILRDQGEAYASKLRDADVPTACVRFNGTMHDFMNLNALRDTETTRAAMNLAASTFRRAFGTAHSMAPS
jgi:alpha/beta hydrolase fold